MKKIITIFLIFVLTICPAVCFAAEYCDFTDENNHYYSYSSTMYTMHPHAGYLECICGKEHHSSKLYMDDCIKCQKELCENGIHYYLHEVKYTDKHNGYGMCFCGKKQYFTSFENTFDFDEQFPWAFREIDRKNNVTIVNANHPHEEYEYDGYNLRKINDSGCIFTACGACQIQSEYYDQVDEYNWDKVTAYQDNYYDDNYDSYYEDYYYNAYDDYYYEDYYYDDYDDDYYEDDYYYDDYDVDNYDGYYDDSEYYEDDYDDGDDDISDEELYEWLGIVKELL